MNLRRLAFSAIRWTTISMVGRTGLQLLQVAILARLLSPSDFGLMALVVAVIAFAKIFTDMGVSNAIIHHQNITEEQLSSLFWLNVCGGGIIMIVLLGLSEPVSSFYQEPSLQFPLMIVSSYFFISGFGQQLRAVAEKELRFAILAKIELCSALFGFATAVIWASISPTVIALVAGAISTSLVTTLLYWLFVAKGWRPMLRFRLGEISHFLNFGGYTMANNLVNTFNSQADIFIGGRILPAEFLGIYSLPRELSLRITGVINPVVTRVGLPIMAKVQSDRVFIQKIYLKMLRMTASVNFPIYLILVFFAQEIVYVLFGPQWEDSVPLLRILALWGMLRSVGNPVGSLLYATGRADLSFKWNFAVLFITAPVIWLGAQWGAMGIALSMLGLMAILFLPGWYFLVWPLCGAGLWIYVLNILIPFSVALFATLTAYSSVVYVTEPLLRLVIGLFVGTVAYIAGSMVVNRQWIEAMRTLFKRS